MTFKHGKFDDSAVLRSLEKIAIDKGLVKGSPTIKSAEHLMMGRDLTPGVNLSESIIKLCAGLRREGLHKHAEDIEKNYVHYKKAQTLYETSKETGEDLIDFAHPEGGHVLKDVEGKHKVMTVTERQEAIKRTLSKEPTGKLSVAEAIQAVKRIFAAEETRKMTLEEYQASLISSIKKMVSRIVSDIKGVFNFVDPLLTGNNDNDKMLEQAKILAAAPSIANLNKTLSLVSAAREEASPGYVSGLNEPEWAVASGQYSSITSNINAAIQKVKEYEESVSSGEVPDTATIKVQVTREQQRTKAKEKREQDTKEAEEDRIDKIEAGQYSLAKDEELNEGGKYAGESWAPKERDRRALAKKRSGLSGTLTASITQINNLKKEINRFKTSDEVTNPDFAAKRGIRENYFNGQIGQIDAAIADAKSKLSNITSQVTEESTQAEVNEFVTDAEEIRSDLNKKEQSIRVDYVKAKDKITANNAAERAKKSGGKPGQTGTPG